MEKLLLWDIDGTLLASNNTGRIIYSAAASRAAGFDVGISSEPTSGKTDPVNLANYLRDGGADVDSLLGDAIGFLPGELRRIIDEERFPATILSGVGEVLEAVSNAGATNTLLTGNLKPNAEAKMVHFDLDGYFDFEIGAYGDDAPSRVELLPVAVERGQKLRDQSFAAQDIWIIGDTVHDFAVAKGNGTRCLLVATGGDSKDDLERCGADAVLEDLTDVDQVLEVLAG